MEKAEHPTPEEQLIRIESINVTCLDHNKKFVAEREAAIVGMQEHKMREEEEKRIQKYFKDEGWELKCGPSDKTTKNRMQE